MLSQLGGNGKKRKSRNDNSRLNGTLKGRRPLLEVLEGREMLSGNPPRVLGLSTGTSALYEGSPFNLSATVDTNTTVSEVSFYLDSNHDGLLTTLTDTLLGSATSGSSNIWSLPSIATGGTNPVGLGRQLFFAQATDSVSELSNVVGIPGEVLSSDPVLEPIDNDQIVGGRRFVLAAKAHLPPTDSTPGTMSYDLDFVADATHTTAPSGYGFHTSTGAMIWDAGTGQVSAVPYHFQMTATFTPTTGSPSVSAPRDFFLTVVSGAQSLSPGSDPNAPDIGPFNSATPVFYDNYSNSSASAATKLFVSVDPSHDSRSSALANGASVVSTLVYNAATVPRPIVEVDVPVDWLPATSATYVAARATITNHGTNFTRSQGPDVYYSLAGLLANQDQFFHLALPAGDSNLETGDFRVTVRLTFVGTGITRELGSDDHFQNARISIVNRSASNVGNRWGIAGLDQVVPYTDGVMLARGDGSTQWFNKDATTGLYQGGMTVVVGPVDSRFHWTSRDGGYEEFDMITGKLLARVDSLGNQSTYGFYSASDTDPGAHGGSLKVIVSTGWRVQTLTYDEDGMLTGITDSADRTTTLDYQDGLLTQITKPDGWSQHFDYDSTTKLLTSQTNEAGETTHYEYDNLNRLRRTILPDGSSTILQSTETSSVAQRVPVIYNGFAVNLGFNDSVAAPLLAWNIDSFGPDVANNTFMGAMGRLVDRSGNSVHFTTDPNGHVSSTTQPVIEDSTAPWVSGPSSFSLHDLQTSSRAVTTSPSPSGSGLSSRRYTYDDKFNLTAAYLNDSTTADATWDYTNPGGSNPLNKLFGITLNDNANVYDDRTTSYQRYGNGLLESATDADGNPTTYTYTDSSVPSIPAGMIESITDGNLKVTIFEYFNGNESYAMLESYAASGRLKRIVRADGTAEEAITQFIYDIYGNVSEVTDANNRVTTFQYDVLGRLTQVQQRGFSDAQTAGPTWLYTYNSLGLVKDATDPNGNRTLYRYNLRDQLAAVILPDPAGGGQLPGPETIYFYTPNSQVDTVIDPLGRWTQFTYDARDQLTTLTQADPATGLITSSSPETHYSYNDAGYLTSVENPNESFTLFAYDADRGWLTSMRSIHEDSGGNEVANNGQTSGSLGLLASYDYNAFGDRISVTVPVSSGVSRTTSMAYDNISRLISVTQPDPDGSGSLHAAKTTYGYDANSNLRFVTIDPYHATTNPDGLNQITEFVYDPLNRLTDEIAPEPTTGAGHPTTHRTYDLIGSLASLTDPNGNETSWTHDVFGLLETEVATGFTGGSPLYIGTRSYEHDANGNLTTFTDRNGRLNEYDYDSLNRITTEKWFDGISTPTLTRTLNYAYDVVGNLTSTSDPSASYNFYYDELNRQSSNTATLAGLADSVTLDSQYDANGNRIQVTATIGTTADFANNYTYNLLNQLTGLSQTDQAVTGANAVADKQVGFAYNDAGQFTQLNRFNHLVSNPADLGVTLNATTGALARSVYSYDQAERLTGLGDTPVGSSAITQSWTYDSNRVTSYAHSTDGTTDYEYDDTNQLREVTGAVGGSYEYDANGNRTSGGAVVAPGNRLSSDGTFDYTYDSEGNRTRSVNQTTGEQLDFTYDHRNRLVEVKRSQGNVNQPSVDLDYEYDTLGRLVSRTESAYTYAPVTGAVTSTSTAVEKRVYDGDHVVLDFAKPNGGSFGLSHRYMYGPAVDQLLAQETVSSPSSAGSVVWMLSDNEGSVRDLLDNSGSTVTGGHFKYDAFGQIIAGDTSLSRYLYTGRDYDATTGMQYNRARWYDSGTGRWLSEDPLGFGDGPNPFIYVRNNPTNLTDPSGLESEDNSGGNSGGGGGGGGGGSGGPPPSGDNPDDDGGWWNPEDEGDEGEGDDEDFLLPQDGPPDSCIGPPPEAELPPGPLEDFFKPGPPEPPLPPLPLGGPGPGEVPPGWIDVTPKLGGPPFFWNPDKGIIIKPDPSRGDIPSPFNPDRPTRMIGPRPGGGHWLIPPQARDPRPTPTAPPRPGR